MIIAELIDKCFFIINVLWTNLLAIAMDFLNRGAVKAAIDIAKELFFFFSLVLVLSWLIALFIQACE